VHGATFRKTAIFLPIAFRSWEFTRRLSVNCVVHVTVRGRCYSVCIDDTNSGASDVSVCDGVAILFSALRALASVLLTHERVARSPCCYCKERNPKNKTRPHYWRDLHSGGSCFKDGGCAALASASGADCTTSVLASTWRTEVLGLYR
jgi:hypothetical protein